jgi:hypothetical protein
MILCVIYYQSCGHRHHVVSFVIVFVSLKVMPMSTAVINMLLVMDILEIKLLDYLACCQVVLFVASAVSW